MKNIIDPNDLGKTEQKDVPVASTQQVPVAVQEETISMSNEEQNHIHYAENMENLHEYGGR